MPAFGADTNTLPGAHPEMDQHMGTATEALPNAGTGGFRDTDTEEHRDTGQDTHA